MRYLTIFLFISLARITVGQVEVQQPVLRYVSNWNLEDLLELKLGAHILFEQKCSPLFPSEIPNGTVYFENVCYRGKYRCSMSVEFKDTVVSVVKFFMRAKDDSILQALGLFDIKAEEAAGHHKWSYVCFDGNKHTTMIGDKKEITVIQTL